MIDNRRIALIANLGSYQPRFVVKRLVYVAISSVILLHLAVVFTDLVFTSISNRFLSYGIIILAFNSVSEINILLVRFLQRFETLRSRIIPQIVIIFVSIVILVYFWTVVASHLFKDSEIINHRVTHFVLLMGFFFLVVMHILIMMSNITNEWMESRREVERLKNAKLQSDYNSLQDRLNPHFLFNNLSVLKSLIHYSPEDAEKFTQNFTDVYRYMLKSHESKMVTVANELEFLKAYIALHQERLGEGLKVSIDVPAEVLQKNLPPMSIQLLVENAIKHNVVSRFKPLHIFITSGATTLTVRNKINIKETTYSTHTGLKTLQAQFQLISDRNLVIQEEMVDYVVSVPLL